MHSKQIVAIFSMIVLLVLLVSGFLFYSSPGRIFYRKFGFKLPENSRIINSQSTLVGEKTLKMKVEVSATDYSKFIDDLNLFFKGENSLLINLKDNYVNKRFEVPANWNEDHPNAAYKKYLIPAFQSNCSWWDLNEDEIILGYGTFKSGIKVKTKEVYVFVTQGKDGKYFFYIVN